MLGFPTYHAALTVNGFARGALASLTGRLTPIDSVACGVALAAPGNPAPVNYTGASMPTLYVRDSSGFREAQLPDVLERAHALLSQRYRRGAPVLSSPSLTREFLRTRLAARDYESFGLIHLDVRYRLLAVEDLFRGTIDRASVHPREVVKTVISHGSAAVLLYHNHVSGQSSPSAADEQITRHIQQVLATLDVKVVDHLIIADPIFSFAEAGLL